MEAKGFYVTASMKSGKTVVGGRTFTLIHDTMAYAIAVGQSMADGGGLMIRSGQDTEAFIFLPRENVEDFTVKFLLEDKQ